jgi:hypothetical protein
MYSCISVYSNILHVHVHMYMGWFRKTNGFGRFVLQAFLLVDNLGFTFIFQILI